MRIANKDENADPTEYAWLMVSAAVDFIATDTDGRDEIVVDAGNPGMLPASTRD